MILGGKTAARRRLEFISFPNASTEAAIRGFEASVRGQDGAD